MNAVDRFFDMRGPERRPVLTTFGALFLIVVAHTVLETARDALFLRHVGVGSLGWMYIVAAGVTLVVGSVAARTGERFGPRRALIVGQIVAAVVITSFFFLPPTHAGLMALYAFSAVVGALLVPQLWSFVAVLFHAGQSRRLFGTIALAGVAGAVAGSSLAAALLLVMNVQCLLLLSAIAFGGSALVIAFSPRPARVRHERARCSNAATITLFRHEPVLLRMALVVALGSICTLLVDYAFKAAITVHVRPDDLGSFLARYNAATNVLALIVQLAFARRILSRAGVIGTTGILPSTLFTGTIASVVTGGAFVALLGAKVLDAAFRHSVYRTGLELVSAALPTAVRNRAKPIIDGVIARSAQAIGAGILLLLAALSMDSIAHVTLIATVVAVLWSAAAYSMRAPYIALFRRSVVGPDVVTERPSADLDLASAEILVEAISSRDPREVVAAMGALERRSRGGLVPALVLMHEDEDVLTRALELFGSSTRKDWIHLAEKRTSDPRERVRRAALRALARGASAGGASSVAVRDERPWIRGYIAAREFSTTTGDAAEVMALITEDAAGDEVRLGVLTAIGDGVPTAKLADLLVEVAGNAPPSLSREAVELSGRASMKIGDERMTEWLVERLALRDGRSAVRDALVALGQPAFDAISTRLRDVGTARTLRVHLPRTLSRFGTQPAADLLFELLQKDGDGLVRYKCLRGLGRLVVDHGATLPAATLRALARRDLEEHFRLRGLRAHLGMLRAAGDPAPERTKKLLTALLGDKSHQALERVFRLLKLAFPHEDIHRVHTATLTGDAPARANASEFLEALLAPRRRADSTDDLRPLLRLLNAELQELESLGLSAELIGTPLPSTPVAALAVLVDERDVTVASVATVLARQLASPDFAAVAKKADRRPSIVDSVEKLLAIPPPLESARG